MTQTTRNAVLVLIVALAFIWPRAASGQAPTPITSLDPYRNFMGSWSGTIPINAEKMPSTVKVVVSETRKGKSMRWDYVFGMKGEKGYTHDTKWITLDPVHAKMTTHWKHKDELVFRTQGLTTLVQNGFGVFVAENYYPQNGTLDRVTFQLTSDMLSYLWETSQDGKNFSIYSKFEFKRDPTSSSVNNPASNKE